MEEFEYKEIYQYPYHGVINVTDDCNLRCQYCFTEHSPHYMTLETAMKTADWLYNNKIKQEEIIGKKITRKCEIYFFGGEPMLCYKTIIIPLVEYCKDKYPNAFAFGLTTNGTLLTKDSIDFFVENNFKLLLSFDGNRKTQEYNRPSCNKNISSYDLVTKNLKYLLEKIPQICCRQTINPETVEELFNNYLEAEQLGFNTIELIENTRGNWTTDKIKILKEEFSKIYIYRLKQIINNEKVLEWERWLRWLRFTTLLCNTEYYGPKYFNVKFNHKAMRCGLGTTTIGIGYDGSLIGCQEWSTKDNKDIFNIGNIYNGGIDKEKHYNLLKFYNDSDYIKINNKCENCFGKEICTKAVNNCPSVEYELYHNMSTIPEITCIIRQLYYKNSLSTLNFILMLDDDKLNTKLKEIIERE